MSTTPSPVALSPSPARRPWWRLHLSTWFFVLATAGVPALYNFAEFEYLRLEDGDAALSHITRGWPWVWASYLPDREVFQRPSVFAPDPGRRWNAVTGDLAVAIAILSSVGLWLESRRRRRSNLFQFTLLEIIGAITVCAVGMAWLRSHYGATTAVAELQTSMMVSVEADDYMLPATLRRAFARWWCREQLAEGYSIENVSVNLPTQRVHAISGWGFDEAISLQPLLKLPHLQGLHIDLYRPYTDGDLQVIGRLQRLRSLTLVSSIRMSPPIYNNICLRDLSPLSRLEYLALGIFYDPEVQEVPHFPRLKGLHLSGGGVTDQSLTFLMRYPLLQSLDLSGTAVTDLGLLHLSECSSLTELNLARTKITDEGIASLRSLKNLRVIDLTETDISDLGIARLADIPNLEKAQLDGTKTTKPAKKGGYYPIERGVR